MKKFNSMNKKYANMCTMYFYNSQKDISKNLYKQSKYQLSNFTFLYDKKI